MTSKRGISNVKILSLNCRGLNNIIKVKRLASILHRLAPDIIFFQETHLREKIQFLKSFKKFDQQFYASGSSKSRDTAILVSK